MTPELNPYERWMVQSNLETIASTAVTAEEQAARLRANGYPRIADAVLAEHGRTGGNSAD